MSAERANETDPLRWSIGIVGYGEVGRILAEDLRAQGVAVLAYDVKLDRRRSNGGSGDDDSGSDASAMRAHALQHGVTLADSHAALAAGCNLLVSAVTASQAVPVATACAPSLRTGTWFLDFNSASPGAKKNAAMRVDAAHARYVEGAVMTSVPPYRIRVPLLLGGPHARALAPLLAILGFDATVASDEIGIASATKMCRSVMIKGLEAMVIESLVAARAWGVEDRVLVSLAETFPGIEWEQQADYFFERVIGHGRRRAEEMREAANTVREVGLEPWSAAGTANRQAWVADLAARGVFDTRGAQPGDAHGWRRHADRILALPEDER